MHHWYGVLLYAIGRIDESVSAMARARQLDPFGSTIATDGAVALYSAGRSAEAHAEVRRSLDLDSTKSDTYLVQGWVYLGEGKGDSAIAALTRARLLGTGFDILPYLSVAHRQLHNADEAERLYREVQRGYQRNQTNPLGVAIAATAAGDKVRAMEALERTFAGREPLVTELSLPCDPLLAPLHGEPRFDTMLSRAGMTRCRE